MKNLVLVLVSIVLGALVYHQYQKRSGGEDERISTELVLDNIKSVSKLVTTEAEFTEVFSYKKSKDFFLNTIPLSKKAIVVVKAKVLNTYDLTKMKYEVDSVNMRVIIKQLPSAEYVIEPNIEYIDLQDYQIYSFNKDDFNKIQKQAIFQIKRKITNSSFDEQSFESLEKSLKVIEAFTKAGGWTFINDAPQPITVLE